MNFAVRRWLPFADSIEVALLIAGPGCHRGNDSSSLVISVIKLPWDHDPELTIDCSNQRMNRRVQFRDAEAAFVRLSAGRVDSSARANLDPNARCPANSLGHLRVHRRESQFLDHRIHRRLRLPSRCAALSAPHAGVCVRCTNSSARGIPAVRVLRPMPWIDASADPLVCLASTTLLMCLPPHLLLAATSVWTQKRLSLDPYPQHSCSSRACCTLIGVARSSRPVIIHQFAPVVLF